MASKATPLLAKLMRWFLLTMILVNLTPTMAMMPLPIYLT